MNKLIDDVKIRLEDVLDEQFPKGKPSRGAALMLFAFAMSEIYNLVKAFGGCTKCYGKGYGTQTVNYKGRGEADMGDADIVIDEKAPTMVFCTCGRGQQLQQLIGEHAV